MNNERSDTAEAWLDPWSPSEQGDDSQDAAFCVELAREAGLGHVLHGVPVRLLGRGMDDDAVFSLQDGSGRVAVVHLTWHGIAEQPPWPETQLYASFDAFRVERMMREHGERVERLQASPPAPPAGGPSAPAAVSSAAVWPRATWLKAAALVGVTFAVAAGLVAWQWSRVIEGDGVAGRSVVVFTAIIVVYLLGGLIWMLARVWPGVRLLPAVSLRRRGNLIAGGLAVLGLAAGFANWAAMVYVGEARAPANEAARVKREIDEHARELQRGVTPMTPP